MDFVLYLIFSICNWIPEVLAFGLLFGRGRILHWGVVGVGLVASYGTFITLDATGSWPLAMITGLSASVLISLLFSWIALRLPNDAFGVLSIALHLALLTVVINWPSLTGGSLGISKIPRPSFMNDNLSYTAVVVLIAILWTIFMVYLDRTKIVRGLRALAEDQHAAAALGIQRGTAYLFAFCICGIGMWVGVVTWAPYTHVLYPVDYGFPPFLTLLTMVIAGRPGNIRGEIVATTFIICLREGLRFLPLPISAIGPVRLLLFGVILLIAVWYRRDVLFPPERKI